MRFPVFMAALVLVAVFAIGVELAFELPDTPDDAYRNSSAVIFSQVSDYTWTCPTGYGTRECTLSMVIPEGDFDSSMHRNLFRTATVFTPAPYNLILPDDGYVQIIAQHILSETDSLSDLQKATAALWFVQCTIGYAYDITLYGMENFWAGPVETLYLRYGDCEDTSVLLASILEAMGFDTVLLDYPSHIAVGVKLEQGTGTSFELDDGTYYFCESTCDHRTDIGSHSPSVPIDDIWRSSDADVPKETVNSVLSGYRYLFQRIFSF